MPAPMRKKYGLLVVGLLSQFAWGQNLENIGAKQGIKVNGALNASTIAYVARGIEGRRDPFNWFFSGNLNLNFFGYNAPFSFSYSNAGAGYTQPFNQFSFAPQYKWVKTYIGYNSMTFSPYTLAGHQFFGGGVELTPGPWKVAALYGRLRKEVPFNPLDSLQTGAAFKRMGGGLKVGYELKGHSLSVSYFGAKDDIGSIPFVLPGSGLTPKQNAAVSVSGKSQLSRHLFAEGEYGYSLLTADTRALETGPDSSGRHFLSGLIPTNATTRHFDAYNGSIGYQGRFYRVQLKYERVAPEYETMGAYFFNNDMRNLTVVPALQLFKNRLSLSANVGLQRNNLDQSRTATTRRMVGAFTAAFTPNEKLSFSGDYSNFSTFTRMRPLADPFFRNALDTLNFYQLTQSLSGMSSYQFGPKERKQSLMMNLSYQRASDGTVDSTGNLSDFYTGNLSYSYSLQPANATFSASFNYYTSQSAYLSSTYWGPNLSLSKAFLKKTLKSSLSGSFNRSDSNGQSGSGVINSRLNLSYNPAGGEEKKGPGKHLFSMGLNWLSKLNSPARQDAVPPPAAGYSEWTSSLNYTYSF